MIETAGFRPLIYPCKVNVKSASHVLCFYSRETQHGKVVVAAFCYDEANRLHKYKNHEYKHSDGLE